MSAADKRAALLASAREAARSRVADVEVLGERVGDGPRFARAGRVRLHVDIVVVVVGGRVVAVRGLRGPGGHRERDGHVGGAAAGCSGGSGSGGVGVGAAVGVLRARRVRRGRLLGGVRLHVRGVEVDLECRHRGSGASRLD